MYHEGATEPRDCAERGDLWEALAVALATIPESIRAEQTTIEISGLRKQFGRVTALDDLDLLVPHAAVGMLGANGAGKTTLLRVLLG